MSALENLQNYDLTGSIKFEVSSMEIGDYIPVKYVTTAATALGTISEVGEVDYENTADWSIATPTTEGVVYFMKVAKGLLVSTTRMFSGVTYLQLNNQNLISGNKTKLSDNKNYLVRVPSFTEFQIINNSIDGVVDRDNRGTLFGDEAIANVEWVQEMDASIQGATACLNTTSATATVPPTYAATSTTYYARLVLIYPDNANSVDVFH